MAVRPVFKVSLDDRYCVPEDTEFEYFSGFSDVQKKRSIRSLHQAFALRHEGAHILEISGKSEDQLGVELSAFNLMLHTPAGKMCSVESAFQGSKRFERGGPYSDLLYQPSIVAKRDPRLRNSGGITGFCFDGEEYSSEPQAFFYNWLYVNALREHDDLADQVTAYDAFTDIMFNPKRSLNCQADAAAIFVSLSRQDLLDEALASKEDFLRVVYPGHAASASASDEAEQLTLLD